MDVSSAAAVQASLAALRSHPDPRMLDIVQLLATKPMQASLHMVVPISCPPLLSHSPLLTLSATRRVSVT